MRNYQLDFYKLLFAVCIFTLHTVVTFDVANSAARGYVTAWGNICVNFFFVISGILMVNSYFKHREKFSQGNPGLQTLRFVIGKFKGLAVIYFTNLFICFTVESARIIQLAGGSGDAFSKIADLFIHAIPEMLAIEMIGIRPIGLNNASWYVSAMLIAMIPLFYLLLKHTDVFLHIIAPIAAFSLFAFFYRGGAIFCDQNAWYGFCTGGVLRAICGLCFGVVCWLISDRLRSLSRRGRIAVTIYEVCAFLFLVYFLLFMPKTINNVYPALMVTMPLLASAFSGASLLSNCFQIKAFRFFNAWSMYIYFAHTASTKVISYWLIAPGATYSLGYYFALMIGLTLLFCLITFAVSLIVKRLKARAAGAQSA